MASAGGPRQLGTLLALLYVACSLSGCIYIGICDEVPIVNGYLNRSMQSNEGPVICDEGHEYIGPPIRCFLNLTHCFYNEYEEWHCHLTFMFMSCIDCHCEIPTRDCNRYPVAKGKKKVLAGMSVAVVEPFTTNDKTKPIHLVEGNLGVVVSIGARGNAKIKFYNDDQPSHLVLRSNFGKLKFQLGRRLLGDELFDDELFDDELFDAAAPPRILRGHHGGGAGGGAPPLPINITAYYKNAPKDGGPYKCVKSDNSTGSDTGSDTGSAPGTSAPSGAATQNRGEEEATITEAPPTETAHEEEKEGEKAEEESTTTTTSVSTEAETTTATTTTATTTTATTMEAETTTTTPPPPPPPPGKGDNIQCKLEDRCVCQKADIQVCKMTCNMDEKCVGYLEAATGGACEYATKAECKSGCQFAGNEATGPIVKGPFVSDYLGCYEDVVKKEVTT